MDVCNDSSAGLCAMFDAKINATILEASFNLTQSSENLVRNPPEGFIVVACILAICVSLTTVCGNVMVMLSFYFDKSLRHVNNYFLFSLATADIMIGIVSVPLFTTYLTMGYWPFGSRLCDVWLSIDYTMSNASVVNLLVICIDRYLSITRPLTYRIKRTKRKAVAMICSAWCVSIGLWLPWILAWPHLEGKRKVASTECHIQFLASLTVYSKLFTILTTLLAFFIPVTIMCVLYYKIYLETQRRYDDVRFLQADKKHSFLRHRLSVVGRSVRRKFHVCNQSVVSISIHNMDRATLNEHTPPSSAPAAGVHFNATFEASSPTILEFRDHGITDNLTISEEDQPLLFENKSANADFESQMLRKSNEINREAQQSGLMARDRGSCPILSTPNLQVCNDSLQHELYEDKDQAIDMRESFTMRQSDVTTMMGGHSLTTRPNPSCPRLDNSTFETTFCSYIMTHPELLQSIDRSLATSSLFSPMHFDCGDESSIKYFSYDSRTISPTASLSNEEGEWFMNQSISETPQKICKPNHYSGKPVDNNASIAMNDTHAVNRKYWYVQQGSGLRHKRGLSSLTLKNDSRSEAPDGLTRNRYNSEKEKEKENTLSETMPRQSSLRSGSKLIKNLRSFRVGFVKNQSVETETMSLGGKWRPMLDVPSNLERSASSLKRSRQAKQQQQQQQQQEKKEESKAARTLTAVLLAFIITWAPYNIFTVISVFCENRDCIPTHAYNLGYWLCYINSAVNPILYALCNVSFRRAFYAMITCQGKRYYRKQMFTIQALARTISFKPTKATTERLRKMTDPRIET